MVGAIMSRWRLKNILKEVVFSLLIFFVVSMVLNYIRQPDTIDQLTDQSVKLISGEEVDLFEKDRVTLIHFWATWCPTCKFEASNIEDLLDEDIHLVTIAVNSGNAQKIEQFMQQKGYHYPVVNDNKGVLSKAFGVEVYPTTLIYDKGGRLRFTEVGYTTTLGLKARLELIQ
jgi:thiol-disulfide isomerase/thioredoxin